MKINSRARRGFVLPAILFGMVVMSILATAALHTSVDEGVSVRSFRESGMALFVADGGFRQTIGNWPSGANSLNPGDSLDLGWQTFTNRGRYRAVIHRVDNVASAPPVYTIVVQGRGAGKLAGQRTVVAML